MCVCIGSRVKNRHLPDSNKRLLREVFKRIQFPHNSKTKELLWLPLLDVPMVWNLDKPPVWHITADFPFCNRSFVACTFAMPFDGLAWRV